MQEPDTTREGTAAATARCRLLGERALTAWMALRIVHHTASAGGASHEALLADGFSAHEILKLARAARELAPPVVMRHAPAHARLSGRTMEAAAYLLEAQRLVEERCRRIEKILRDHERRRR